MDGKYNLNQRNQRVNVDHFSMVPRADIPRSTFTTEHTHKTTFDGGWLIPVLLTEVLPGDSMHGTMTLFARMQTLLFPLMEHITLESFFFFVPARILWDNWPKFMGERKAPADSISYTVPIIVLPHVPNPAVYPVGNHVASLYDYMGVPSGPQLAANSLQLNSLPFRAYNLIHNEWFRDENLINPVQVLKTDGPDDPTFYHVLRRGKRHDYFTSALPWPLKNNAGVALPLTGQAPIQGIGIVPNAIMAAGPFTARETDGSLVSYSEATTSATFGAGQVIFEAHTIGAAHGQPDIYADLSQATGATIAALRLAVQTQRLLERDARGGTRYTELLRSHFGVMPEDARLQRPEYIGGGRSTLQTSAIPQTSATGVTGGASPLGALGAQATATGQHTFRYNATEHGYVLGLLHADAELTYQQGLARLFTRRTRYDFYWPVFAHLSEQPIRNDEIYAQGDPAQDQAVFGYQERWAEYRHRPSRITGMFRSTVPGSLDAWHSAQHFTALPTLSATFITSNPPFPRNLAAGSQATNFNFLADMLFRMSETRAMPMYSVPGSMDRF